MQVYCGQPASSGRFGYWNHWWRKKAKKATWKAVQGQQAETMGQWGETVHWVRTYNFEKLQNNGAQSNYRRRKVLIKCNRQRV